MNTLAKAAAEAAKAAAAAALAKAAAITIEKAALAITIEEAHEQACEVAEEYVAILCGERDDVISQNMDDLLRDTTYYTDDEFIGLATQIHNEIVVGIVVDDELVLIIDKYTNVTDY